LPKFVARRGEFGKSCSREPRVERPFSTLDSFAAPPQSTLWLRRSRARIQDRWRHDANELLVKLQYTFRR